MGDGSSENAATVFVLNEEERDKLMVTTTTTSEQLVPRFHPNDQDFPLDKYTFLQQYSDMKQTTEDSVMCIDIDDTDDVAQSHASGLTEEKTAAFSVKRSQGMDLGTDSDGEDDNWNSSSKPSSSVYGEKNEEGEVSFRPDFITCGTTLYVEPLLTFSPVGIKLVTSDSGYDEEITMEWEISKIIYINCIWTASAESVSLKILIQADYDGYSEKECCVKLSFFVSHINWQEKEYKIKTLASRYEEIWNSVPQIDTCDGDDNVDSASYFPKYYFSEIEQNSEDALLIYPNGDPDAVSISKRDVDLLLPGTFINDNIIDFYIKYLSSRIPQYWKQRLHFFNTFFFRKLVDLDRNPGTTDGGRAAFLRVKKWTRKLNIFDKEFIFIPVNFKQPFFPRTNCSLHWSLLVICHPGKIIELEDDVMESLKVPCVLHMDSLKGSHTGLKDIIQSYLSEEWKDRHPNTTEDDLSKFLTLRFVSLELPQQENCFDCGLFLLHYVERFLDDAFELNPLTVSKYSCCLTPEWFPPAEASYKRSLIRLLIYNLLHNTREDGTTAADVDIRTNGHTHYDDTEVRSQFCCPTEMAISPVSPVDDSVSSVVVTHNEDDSHDKVEGENVAKNIFEGISQYEENTSIQLLVPETCVIVDEEGKPSSILNDEDKPDENHCSGPLVCNLETTNFKLDASGFLEDSSKKDGIMKGPAPPVPNTSEYASDTPVMPVSLPEPTGKDDGEKAEKSITDQVRNTPHTSIMSSEEISVPNHLQNKIFEYVSETGSISAALMVLSNTNCEKVEKCVPSEIDYCKYVPESPVLPPPDQLSSEVDCNEMEQVEVQIDEITGEVLHGEKERSSDGGEGSVDKDEVPHKKRRRVDVLPEVSRSVTRSSTSGNKGEKEKSNYGDGGSVDKDEMPRKNRRGVALLPESRRVSRSSTSKNKSEKEKSNDGDGGSVNKDEMPHKKSRGVAVLPELCRRVTRNSTLKNRRVTRSSSLKNKRVTRKGL